MSITTADGCTHSVQAHGSSLFAVAAEAIFQLRSEGWTEALTPNAVLRVEVQLPPVVHEVPVKAVERWLREPSTSPRDELAKKKLGGALPRSKSASSAE